MHYVESIREEPLTFLYFDYNYYHIQILTCRFRRWLSGAIRYLNSCVSVCNTVNIFPRKIFSPVRHSPTLFQWILSTRIKVISRTKFVFFSRLLVVVPFTQIYSWWKLFSTITFLIYQYRSWCRRKIIRTHTHTKQKGKEKKYHANKNKFFCIFWQKFLMSN